MGVSHSIEVAASNPLVRALANANSNRNQWTDLRNTDVMPSGDGVFPAGRDGIWAPDRLLLMPICVGPVASKFSMRLYGWYELDPNPARQGPTTWIWALLVELACEASNSYGPIVPQQTGGASYLTSVESTCDTITLVRGQVGANGHVNSPGAGLTATAKIDLAGCRLFQVDFKQTDPVAMNCLLARA